MNRDPVSWQDLVEPPLEEFDSEIINGRDLALQVESPFDMGAIDIEILRQAQEAVESVQLGFCMTQRLRPVPHAVALKYSEFEIENRLVSDLFRDGQKNVLAFLHPAREPEAVAVHPRSELHVVKGHLEAMQFRSREFSAKDRASLFEAP